MSDKCNNSKILGVKLVTSESLIWVGLVAMLTLAMFLTVPLPNINRLLLFGLVGGFGLGIVVMTIMDPVLHLSGYKFASLPGWLGIPVLAAMAWFPAEIIFANYLAKMDNKTSVYLFVVATAFGATLLDYLCLRIGIREFIKWNLFNSFLLSLAIHTALAYYLRVTGYAREKIS